MNKKLKKYILRSKKALLIITFTGIIYNVGKAIDPWFEGQMVQLLCNVLNGQDNYNKMILVVVAYVATAGIVQGMRYLKRLYVRKFANRINREMRLTLFENFLLQNADRQSNTGALMTKMLSDADRCVEGIRKFVTEIFDTGVVMVAYLTMLIYYDWKLTLIAMLFPPIAYILAEKLKKS